MERPDAQARPEQLVAAEKAYERGLACRALLHAWPAAIVAIVAIALARPPIVAVALVAAVVVFLYLGRGFARGAWTGLAVGVVPAFAPVVAQWTHHCGSACDTLCVVVCGAGGLIAGVVAGTAARGDGRRALASIVCAGCMGALGCTALGVVAVVGMSAALCSGCALPALFMKRSAV
jgi:hypothetical protein